MVWMGLGGVPHMLVEAQRLSTSVMCVQSRWAILLRTFSALEHPTNRCSSVSKSLQKGQEGVGYATVVKKGSRRNPFTTYELEKVGIVDPYMA